jgi:hypothetical protein
MIKTGMRNRRTLRKGWLAGLTVASLGVVAQAEAPRFVTRGATPVAFVQGIQPVSHETVADEKKDEKTAAVAAPAPCANGTCCDERSGICDNMVIFGAVNAWRGPLDSVSESSFGVVGGFNAGAPLLTDYGLGVQFGMSYGIYDFHGRDEFGPESEPSSIEDQLFFTTGVFRRCVSCCDDPCGSAMDRISWGLVYDRMITDNTGAVAAELSLGQFRGQIGYACDCANEVGIQGSFSDGTDDDFDALGFDHTTRSIDQISVYWRHLCACNGLDSRVYTGWAEELGEWVIGANATLPIDDCWALFGGFTYIMPSSEGGDDGSAEEYWNVMTGLAYYPGGNARSTSICCPRWMPLLPVADNGSFALDLGGPEN